MRRHLTPWALLALLPGAALAVDTARGQNLYTAQCRTCHAARPPKDAREPRAELLARPVDAKRAPDLARSVVATPPAQLERWMREAHKVAPSTPCTADRLGRRGREDVLAYLYSLAQPPPPPPDALARQRLQEEKARRAAARGTGGGRTGKTGTTRSAP